MKHNDKSLNILRLVAFSAVGFYLYQVYKKQGSLSGVSHNPEFSINTDRVVDYIMPFVDVPPQYKEIVKNGAKEALKGYMESKGVKT